MTLASIPGFPLLSTRACIANTSTHSPSQLSAGFVGGVDVVRSGSGSGRPGGRSILLGVVRTSISGGAGLALVFLVIGTLPGPYSSRPCSTGTPRLAARQCGGRSFDWRAQNGRTGSRNLPGGRLPPDDADRRQCLGLFAGPSGFSLNDNLWKRYRLPQILTVVGHKAGLDVLNQGLESPTYVFDSRDRVLAGLGRASDWSLERWASMGNPRGLRRDSVASGASNHLHVCLSVRADRKQFVSRTVEYEADI